MKNADEQINFRKIIGSALVTMLVMAVLLYVPSPFVVIEPGIAISTKPVVRAVHGDVTNTDIDNEGTFLLTAIKLETPSIWDSLLSLFHPQHSVLWKADVLGKDSIEQYMQRSTMVMKTSHDDALEATYRHLNIPYSIESQAIYVTNVKMNGLGVRQSEFRAGDQIIALEHGSAIHSMEQLIEELMKSERLEQVSIEVKGNDGSKRMIEVQSVTGWQDADDQAEKLAELFGITGFTELRAIIASDSQYELIIDSKSIGGPSAGLILTLTMIDALTEGDLTKGLTIAATGSIDVKGNVGAIGGISQKVYTTSKRGAKLFIVPKANEREAKEKAKRLKTSMDVVGVNSLSEAIEVISSYE